MKENRSGAFSETKTQSNGVAKICSEYGGLDNEDKQKVLGFIVDKAKWRKARGDIKQPDALDNLATHLAQNYGGFGLST